jgi:chromosome segregation ATPase
MANEAEKFLQAEEDINKILDSLSKLEKETESYKTAKDNLDTVASELSELIKGTDEVVKFSKESLLVLKDMGGPKILEDLTNLKNEIDNKYSNLVNELKSIIGKNESEFTKLKEENKNLNNSLIEQGKKISINFILLVSANVFSIIVFILILIFSIR